MLKLKHKKRGSARLVSLLDIGSSKVSCMIVALAPWAGRGHTLGAPVPARLLGIASKESRGVKAGVIVDLDDAEACIRHVVSKAETMAGLMIDSVVVSVSCGRLTSTNFTARVKTANGKVTRGAVERLLQAGRRFGEREDRIALHLAALGYEVNGATGIREPVGLAGDEVRADVHIVTAEEPPLRTLTELLDRCYLSVEGLVPTPYASGLAVLTQREARLGVTCIDMGGGATTLSVFAEGQFIYTDAIALGGSHITFDIARALSTPLAEAERIKTLYGTLVAAASDSYEAVTYPVVGEHDEVELFQTTRAQVRDIVRARADETLRLISDRLDRSGFRQYAGERVVLTGGASELTGLGAHAAQYFGKAVRIGRPKAFGGMPESLGTPPFATLNGLLQARVMPQAHVGARDAHGIAGPSGYLGRVGQWFKESFWDEEQQLAG